MKWNLVLTICVLTLISLASFVLAQNETNSDCRDDFYSDLYCFEGEVYRDLHSFSNECIENISLELVEECEFDCGEGICIQKPEPICDLNNLKLCTLEEDCLNVGGYWYNDHCNDEPKPFEVPSDCNGCVLNDQCYPFNHRRAEQYCSIETKKWEIQRSLGNLCDDDFECKSNFCTDGKCSKIDFITRLINWIMSLFGWGA